MSFSEAQRERLLEKYTEYPLAAYEFVADATSSCISRFEKPRHVSASELVAYLREHAVGEFGVMAPTVLREWSLCSPRDIGKIVYRLIGMGILSASPEDSEADFDFHAPLFRDPPRRRRRVAAPKLD